MNRVGAFAVTMTATLALFLALSVTAKADDAGTKGNQSEATSRLAQQGAARGFGAYSAENLLDDYLTAMQNKGIPGEDLNDRQLRNQRQSYWMQKSRENSEETLKRVFPSYKQWRDGAGARAAGEALLQGAEAILASHWVNRGHADLSRMGVRTIVLFGREYLASIGIHPESAEKRAHAYPGKTASGLLDTCTDCMDWGFSYAECQEMLLCP